MSDDLSSTLEVDSTKAPQFNLDKPLRDHAGASAGGVDVLVRHLRRQTLIPDLHTQSSAASSSSSTTMSEPTLEPPMPSEHCEQRPSLLDSTPKPLNQISGEQNDNRQATSGAPSLSSATERIRRHAETRHCKKLLEPPDLSLMTDMIENGVQCNVRSSSPSTAPPQPTKPPGHAPDQEDVSADQTDLEVDLGYCREHNDEALLGEAVIWKHAGPPAGVSKFSLLRYRSSTEAALACKNMKRSVPRMRRRRGHKSPASEAGPSTSTAV